MDLRNINLDYKLKLSFLMREFEFESAIFNDSNESSVILAKVFKEFSPSL